MAEGVLSPRSRGVDQLVHHLADAGAAIVDPDRVAVADVVRAVGTPNLTSSESPHRVRNAAGSISDVPDGLSQTIAVGESSYYGVLSEWPFWLGAAMEDETTLFKTEQMMNCWKPGAARTLPAEAVTDD